MIAISLAIPVIMVKIMSIFVSVVHYGGLGSWRSCVLLATLFIKISPGCQVSTLCDSRCVLWRCVPT
jgi:hypothetical protein